MEPFKEFLSDLKDRASNPLVSSFVIAWLLFNWSIPVALFFYSTADLKSDGYSSYIQLIKGNYSNYKMLVYPALISLFYTFLFPYIKARVKLFHAEIEAKNETDILEASKAGRMPVMKYIKLRDEHSDTIKKLNEVVDAESELIDDNTKMKLEKIELQQSLDTESRKFVALIDDIDRLQKVDGSVIVGKWDVTKKNSDGVTSIHEWEIHQDYFLENGITYLIQSFVINPFSRKLAFRYSKLTKEGDEKENQLFLQADEQYKTLKTLSDFAAIRTTMVRQDAN
jgi:hypothetical protein